MTEIIKRHISADPELEQKLTRSKDGLQIEQLRAIRCPCCGYYMLDVFGHDHYYIRVKCRKCKFNEFIDTALFRTIRSRSHKKKLGM